MNYFLLLARMLAVLYAGFFMLFAFGEGITGYGATHLPAPVIILLVLVVLWEKPVWSAIGFTIAGFLSIIFYDTLTDKAVFLIVTGPLGVISILFLFAYLQKRKLRNAIPHMQNSTGSAR